MTDHSMNDESAIPREAAWPPEVVELVKALREAIKTIRVFHGLGLPLSSEPGIWKAYQQSPEMKRINSALAPFKEIAND